MSQMSNSDKSSDSFLKRIVCAIFPKEDKRKLKHLVKSNGFEAFIMSIIVADATVLGVMSTTAFESRPDLGLVILDKLFMSIFIAEMVLKIYALGGKFFKLGWNVFDLFVIVISSFPLTSSFIVLRTFRIFRMFKFIQRWSLLGDIVSAFIALIPAMFGLGVVAVVFFYAFTIISVNLYGDIFSEFESLLPAMAMTLETFSIDGWTTPIATRVISIFPHSWVFFGVQSLVAFLLIISFIATAIAKAIKIVNSN